MNRILQRIAYNNPYNDPIEYLNLDSASNTLENVEVNDIINNTVFEQIKNDLKSLKKYKDKKEFNNITTRLFNNVSYFNIKLEKLKKITEKLLKT